MPPRLLAGITLLFWGAMTGHTQLGLIAALLLEARSWVNLRWNFSKITYVRAWHYTILCGALVAILSWVNGTEIRDLHKLFIWTPLILLPVELAMRYGKDTQIPLNTFSFFARKKWEHDLKLGRDMKWVHPRMINTGYPYIALVLLATSTRSQNELHHFIGLTIIISIALLCNGRKSGFRPIAWATGLIAIIALTLVSQWGMGKLHHYLRNHGAEGAPTNRISTNESRTSIGKLGKLKLDPRIQWRMTVDHGDAPKLLRVATYNQYASARWKYIFNSNGHSDQLDQRDEKGYLSSTDLPNEDIRIFKEDEQSPMPQFTEKPNLNIIGAVNTKALDTPIPMPHFMQAVGRIGSLGIEASIDSNTLGSVRLANPDYHVIQYQIWTGDKSTTELAHNSHDLIIPQRERNAIRRVCQSLGLKNQELTTQQKIKRLDHFFRSQFTYTTHLTTPDLKTNQRQSAVGTFLETTRAGHCEYFATATALLLREAGVPTRYCVGFSVSEHNTSHEEWVMRGTHAHAWCRVWIKEGQGDDAGHWEDLDLTPPSWLGLEQSRSSSWKRTLADWWQRSNENFLIWRTNENNKTRVVTGITTIITLFTLWILWRLFRSRQPHQRTKRSAYQLRKDTPLTPLHKLEPKLTKALGPRPIGMPLGQWVLLVTEKHPDLSTLAHSLTELHNTARFAPQGLSPQQQQELAAMCASLRKQLHR